MSHVQDRRDRNRGWVAVITKPDGGKYDHSRSFRTEKEADDYVTLQDAAKLQGTFVSPSSGATTLAERWEVHRLNTVHLRPSTRARDDSYFFNQILPYLGNKALRDIDHDVLQGWVATLCKTLAPSTVHKAHGIVSKVLAEAAIQKLIPWNPCPHTKLPEIIVNEQMFLDLDQVFELVDAMDERFRLAVFVAAMTGLRASELFGLQVRDVDVSGDWLSIRRSIVEVHGNVLYREYLKTKAGWRDVPLPTPVMEELAVHIQDKAADDYVFTATDGGAIRLNNWRRRYWYPAAVAADVGAFTACTGPGCESCVRARKAPGEDHFTGLRVHDLRHTAVSLWIAENRNMFHITKYLGQTNSSLVDKRYGHLRAKKHDDAQDRMNRKLADGLARRRGDNVKRFPRSA
jgi:integrase